MSFRDAQIAYDNMEPEDWDDEDETDDEQEEEEE